jgi:hypothetical protein
MRQTLGDDPPEGIIVHLVYRTDEGVRHVAAWETAEDWEKFHESRAKSALKTMTEEKGFFRPSGIEPPKEVELLDIWFGPRT